MAFFEKELAFNILRFSTVRSANVQPQDSGCILYPDPDCFSGKSKVDLQAQEKHRETSDFNRQELLAEHDAAVRTIKVSRPTDALCMGVPCQLPFLFEF